MPSDEEVKAAVHAAIPPDAGLDDAYEEYILETVRGVAESVTGADLEPALLEAVGPLLEAFLSEEQSQGFCAQVANALNPTQPNGNAEGKARMHYAASTMLAEHILLTDWLCAYASVSGTEICLGFVCSCAHVN
jgi:hypothetical protein